jgi:Uma2 family endonuclease
MAPPLRLLPGAFTVEMYHKLGELGIFDEDDRVELLDGQIVEMSPIGSAHSAAVIRLNKLLMRRTSDDTAVSMQGPLILSTRWEPQPDIVVIRRAAGFGGDWLPHVRDVVLVVEVADTSLERDRDVKIPRYAHDGVPETWLVDVKAQTITVYRDPTTDGYRDIAIVKRGQTLRPGQLSALEITADEILG